MPDAPDELTLLQADLTDRYRIERELGGGGMSRVFLAHDERLGRRVVVKVLPPTLAAALSAERFRREIMMAAALQHPNIVPVLHAGEAGTQPYFIMPYVDGESLRDRLVRGPLSVREMVSVSRDMARALSFAHGRSIVHRDVKPGNILLSAGAAVVTDFGVAKAVTSARAQPGGPMMNHGVTTGALTSAGTSLGTPTYMAPEQAAADPNVDYRADLYAAGVVMYEMLAGSPPFHGRTPQALLTAQLSEPPPPLASRRYDVPVALDALVMQCLEKDPARRPKSAEALLRRLDDPALLSGAFAAAPAVRRQRRWRLAGTVAAGAGVAALAVVLWWAARSPTPPNDTPSRDAAALLLPPSTPLARSVAVLPLTAVGRDARAGEVAEGLTSELTSAIAGVAGVRVASQTAAVAQRDRRAMPADIARTLGVALLLEGTVQRDGDRLRVVLRLVDAAADSTVWSRSFDGATANVLTVQELASNAVVAAFTARAP